MELVKSGDGRGAEVFRGNCRDCGAQYKAQRKELEVVEFCSCTIADETCIECGGLVTLFKELKS